MKRYWVLLALLAVGCGKKPPEEENATEPTITVESAVAAPRTIHDLVPVDGSFVLAATDYAKLAPQGSGRIVAVFVKEGDSVRKGQLLARLDTSVQAAQQQSANVGAGVARAQSQQAAENLKASEADLKAGIRSAQLALDAAKAERDSSIADAKNELAKLKAGARPQEIAQAQQAVRQAEVAHDKAKTDAERDAALLKEGYVSGQQAQASRSAYQLAESALASAQSQLDLVKAGARSEDMKSAQLKLESSLDLGNKRVLAAQANLDQAKQGQLNVASKARELDAARLGATQKSIDARAATAQTAYSEIRSPFDGVVTRRMMGAGSSADPATPVLEVAKRGATIEFSGQVSPNMAALLRADMPAKYGEAEGTLRSIGVADPMTGQVPVRVVFTHPLSKVSPGLFARVGIELKVLTGAISVPDAAVVTREDKKVVFVIADGEAKMTEVEAGPSEDGFTAVLKGLNQGDKVVLVGQHEISDKAKVEEAKADEKADEPKAGEEK